MKRRHGLVSNSSSSSFILFLDKIPETVEETQKMLFGDTEYVESGWQREDIPVQRIAEIIFEDLRDGGCTLETEEQQVKAIASGWMPGFDYHAADEAAGVRALHGDRPDMKDEEKANTWRAKLKEAWAKRDALEAIHARKLLKEQFSKFDSPKIVVELEYADDSGELHCTIESGYAFENIPHITISRH